MIIAVGVAVIVVVAVGTGVVVAVAVGKGIALGAGVAVDAGAQEARISVKRANHKINVRIAFHPKYHGGSVA